MAEISNMDWAPGSTYKDGLWPNLRKDPVKAKKGSS